MPTETPKKVELDWTAAQKHLDEVEKAIQKYKGEAGMNPFLFKTKVLDPLRKQCAIITSRTPELHAKVMAMKTDVKPLTKDLPPDKPITR